MAKNAPTSSPIDDFAERRRTFLDQLGSHLQAATEGKLPASFAVEGKERHLERLRGRLEEARNARKMMVERFDRQIESVRGEITRLEREIHQDQAVLKKAEKEGKGPVREKAPSKKEESGKKASGKTTRRVTRK